MSSYPAGRRLVPAVRIRPVLFMVLCAIAGLLAGLLGTRAVLAHPVQPARPGHSAHLAQPARTAQPERLDKPARPQVQIRLLAAARPVHPAARSMAWAGNTALNWAETQTGAPYSWGATGPYQAGYDCSGLVWRAFARLGIWLPRTTYGMLVSPRLHRTWTPHRGDLAFYGSGHVEFVTVWWHTTFGAHTWGDPVSWAHYNPAWGWSPTAFYTVF